MPEMELDWRQILANAPGKKQIAEVVQVTYATISRWGAGDTTPRNPQDILRLARAGQEMGIRDLDQALRLAFPDVFELPEEPDNLEIPAAYSSTVLGIRASVARLLLTYTVHNFVYDYILSQIDPLREGLVLQFIQCVEPARGQEMVTTLKVNSGRGTGPWVLKQSDVQIDRWRETLCGTAITSGNPAFYPQTPAHERFSLVSSERIQSIGAFPVTLCGDNIAGVLFVASVKEDFFSSPRRYLLHQYASMMALGLRESQFYPHQCIDLL